jgi:hypothetical protein
VPVSKWRPWRSSRSDVSAVLRTFHRLTRRWNPVEKCESWPETASPTMWRGSGRSPNPSNRALQDVQLIEEIKLIPRGGELVIELVGALAGILALGKEKRPRPGGWGRSTTLVAGARRQRCLTPLNCGLSHNPNPGPRNEVPCAQRNPQPNFHSRKRTRPSERSSFANSFAYPGWTWRQRFRVSQPQDRRCGVK